MTADVAGVEFYEYFPMEHFFSPYVDQLTTAAAELQPLPLPELPELPSTLQVRLDSTAGTAEGAMPRPPSMFDAAWAQTSTDVALPASAVELGEALARTVMMQTSYHWRTQRGQLAFKAKHRRRTAEAACGVG